MHLCRIRGLERHFSKYHSICPPSASITSLRRLEKALHEPRMTFWRILTHSFRSLSFKTSKLWWRTIETLLSRYDQIPKSRGFKSRKDGAHSYLVMKCGTFSESHFWVFGSMWWCRVLLKRPETVFEVLSCLGQQCTNKDVISIALLVQFHYLINKKRLLPNSVTAVQTITEAGHCFLATTRDSSPPFLDQSRSFGC